MKEGDLVIQKDSDVNWKIKHLSELVDEKERVIDGQRLELSRVKSLEAKLLSANNKIQGMCQAAQIDRNRDQSILQQENEKWQTRAMINEERTRLSEAQRNEVSLINSSIYDKQRSASVAFKSILNMPASPPAHLSGMSGSWRPKPPTMKPLLQTRNLN
eukprot:TRINITY_DN9685_c0_g1_i1.p1 TRINITY_DN9685_c0_g1~~TRINITY_DN9685_c0_g1_i1.p1  ORF type:complete len:159 (+),score=36.29 TRINITY_DN9685_c0_g1_i1:143-619(+)